MCTWHNACVAAIYTAHIWCVTCHLRILHTAPHIGIVYLDEAQCVVPLFICCQRRIPMTTLQCVAAMIESLLYVVLDPLLLPLSVPLCQLCVYSA